MSCRNCCPITRNYIGNTAWDLRYRNGYTGGCAGGYGTHSGTTSFEFNSTFHGICGNWASYVNTYSGFSVDWIGSVGVTVCKSGFHGEGRAFDLSQIRFTSGNYFDMNVEWRESCTSLRWIRAYVATAASLRRYCGTVITAWYNTDHHNHIHFDNGVAVQPIRPSWRTDTTLVQAACKYMNGESLTIDGDWGPITEAAYGRLRTKLRMGCRNPKTSTADALLFLHLLANAGFKGQAAGYYVGPC